MHTNCLQVIAGLMLSFSSLHAADKPQELTFAVDGVDRAALLYAPESAKTKPSPLVFVFHGHGGNAKKANGQFHLETEWPEAIVIYMQGIPMATPGDPEGKRNGWQIMPGSLNDRDIKFFDKVLAQLKKDYQVDSKRIYSTGHSNGGYFTYLLWHERADTFAAVAPSAAACALIKELKPKPVLHLAGEKDEVVNFDKQKTTMAGEREINGCDTEGKPWDTRCLIYPSKGGTPAVTYIHPGAHNFDAAEPRLIVKFFKEHPAETK